MINQPNPFGAFLQGRLGGQQYQAGQQEMQQAQETHALRQQAGKQGMNVQQQQQEQALRQEIAQALQYADTPEKWDQAINWFEQNGVPGAAQYRGQFELRPVLASQIGVELPAPVRAFNAMTEGLTEEEREEARRIELGLAPRASSAAIQYREVTGPDGVTRLVALDPRTERVTAPQTQGVAPEQLASRPEEESAGLIAGAQAQARTDVERAADVERLRPKARLTMQRAEGRANRVNELVQDIMPRVNVWTAGAVGRPLSGINGTPAADLRAQIGTLQAIAGFDELGQLRAESPTGGALGQVSERELQFLQSVIANIENSQSPDQLRRNLERFNREVQASWQRVQDAYEMDFGGGEAEAQGDNDPLGLRGR